MTRRDKSFPSARWLTLVLLSAAGLVAGFVGAAAQEGPTTSMTCAAARQVVTQQGAAVLYLSESTFDRFVSSRAYCMVKELEEPAFVPTSDTPRCFVGYRCRESIGPPS